jgi:hypothetical protein
MATSFTTNLRLSNPGLGDTGWGTTVSNGMIDLTDQAVAGQASVSVTAAGPFVLTMPDGASGDARNMFLRFTGTPGGAREVQVPTNHKLYFVTNDSDGAVTVKVSGQTGVVVPVGASMALRINAAGTDVGQALNTATSPTFTGTPTAPTATSGTNTTQLATTAFVQSAIQAAYPVGSIYINATNATNPGTLLGFGTWVAFGAGRVPVGFDSGNPLFDTAEETGGSANATVVSHDHTYSATTGNQSANHTHSPTSGNFLVTGTSPYALSLGSEVAVASSTGTQSADHTHNVSGTTASTGSSGTNANYQPYITVYMWKRTA